MANVNFVRFCFLKLSFPALQPTPSSMAPTSAEESLTTISFSVALKTRHQIWGSIASQWRLITSENAKWSSKCLAEESLTVTCLFGTKVDNSKFVVVLLAGSSKLYLSCLVNKYFVRHEGKCSYSWPSIFLSSNSLDRAGLSVLQRSSITWKISSFSNIHQFKNFWASLMAILRVAKKPGLCQIPATIQVIHRSQRRNCWCKTSHSWSWWLVPCTKKGKNFFA